MNTRATVGCKHIVLIVVIQTIAFGVAELRDGTHQDHADLYKDPNASENAPSCLKGEKIIGPLKCTEPRCHRNLTRLEGGELGRKQKIELVCGEEHYLKTVNMKPLIFEIDNFLSDEECEHIKNLALMEGLESSQTKQQGKRKVVMKDFNHDEQLSLHEMRITLEDGYDVYFDDDDLRQMYEELKLDQNKDDYITVNEMRTVTPAAFSEFVDKWTDARPHLKSRLSEQAWIFPDTVNDEVVDNLKERMLTVLQLPRPLIDKYDAIQVVKYGIRGHYNAHIDSGVDTGEDNSLTCCHLKLARNCRICRYVTFMVYLNDVEKGGETAFPVANNSTYDVEALRHGKKLNLNKYCNKSNLMIKPKKGKAVIWYNHFINEQTGWFGHTDQLTWHGGCPVVKGTKWILNRWINATPDRKLDLKPEY